MHCLREGQFHSPVLLALVDCKVGSNSRPLVIRQPARPVAPRDEALVHAASATWPTEGQRDHNLCCAMVQALAQWIAGTSSQPGRQLVQTAESCTIGLQMALSRLHRQSV